MSLLLLPLLLLSRRWRWMSCLPRTRLPVSRKCDYLACVRHHLHVTPNDSHESVDGAYAHSHF